MKRTLVLSILSALIASGTAHAASLYVKTLWVDVPTQTLTLTYSTDTGFPLGERYAQSTLDCRSGKITSRGYVYAGSREPQFSDEDKDAVAAITKTKLINIGPGVLSYQDSSAHPRFFCKNGLLISDLSSYAKDDRALMFNVSYSDSNLDIDASFGTVKLTIPAFSYRREDEKLATVTVSLSFNGNSLSTVNSLTGFSADVILSRPREAIFLLEKDGKTLRPLMYNGQQPGLRTAVPVKAGKGGGTVTLYYTEDYNGTSWQKAVVDLTSDQVYSTKTGRPANLQFGK
ncbi:hypothetical protein Dxin01_03944 [Deinococcus xinjiangensis]|uniref:Uncharacterized protein n=1 Tax=Deinococcus xinjiangensis TaxID=457454 RepID=A0ABP9VHZ0_9DEIO